MSIGRLALIFVVSIVSGPISPLWGDPTPAPAEVAATSLLPGDSLPATKSVPPADEDDRPRATSTRTPPPLPGRSIDADDDDQPKAPDARTPPAPAGRYLFGLLDSRSSYGRDFFPDTFIGPEFDRETQVELEYAHGQKQDLPSNEGGVEFEWNFLGQFTLAGELGYDSEHEQNARVAGAGSGKASGENADGFERVDLALYHPVFEFVSKDGWFDYTAVTRFDVGIPTRTAISGNDAQLTPYLGQLLSFGEHVSLEVWTGPQFTLAPRQTNQLIYGASCGYRITQTQMALPMTRSVTPILELDGQAPFSNGGQGVLFGVAGFNWQAKVIGELHPRVNLGYQFPLDQGARDQLHWGIVTEVFFDF